MRSAWVVLCLCLTTLVVVSLLEYCATLRSRSRDLESRVRELEGELARREPPPPLPCLNLTEGYVPYSKSKTCSPLFEGRRSRQYSSALMKRVVAYSMYSVRGVLDPYLALGARRNFELVREWYPDWTMRIYVSGLSNESIAELRNSVPEAEIVRCRLSSVPSRNMEYRWLPYDDAEVERFIVRDLDSLPGLREMLAVNEWIASGLQFHAMRDHRQHGVPVLGGMWGATAKAFGFDSMEDYLLDLWKGHEDELALNPTEPGEDQSILRLLWDRVRGRCISHESRHFHQCFGAAVCRDFPVTTRTNTGFVGYSQKNPALLAQSRWDCGTVRCSLRP